MSFVPFGQQIKNRGPQQTAFTPVSPVSTSGGAAQAANINAYKMGTPNYQATQFTPVSPVTTSGGANQAANINATKAWYANNNKNRFRGAQPNYGGGQQDLATQAVQGYGAGAGGGGGFGGMGGFGGGRPEPVPAFLPNETQHLVSQRAADAFQRGDRRQNRKQFTQPGMSFGAGMDSMVDPAVADGRAAAALAQSAVPLQDMFANVQSNLGQQQILGNEAFANAQLMNQLDQTDNNNRNNQASQLNQLLASIMGGLGGLI